MKHPHEMNSQEMNRVFAVLMDSSVQNELMKENHPDQWMLDYVYDSRLRKLLEDYQEKIEKCSILKFSLEASMSEKFTDSSSVKI